MLTVAAYSSRLTMLNPFLTLLLLVFWKLKKHTTLQTLWMQSITRTICTPLWYVDRSRAWQACWAYLRLLSCDWAVSIQGRSFANGVFNNLWSNCDHYNGFLAFYNIWHFSLLARVPLWASSISASADVVLSFFFPGSGSWWWINFSPEVWWAW